MKHLLTTILLLLPAISMWAQHDETEDEYVDDFVSVEAIVSRWTDLPRQGKDISVCAVYWDPEEDFIYTDYKLRWDGNGFNGAVSEGER